jgi:hypothetical protein
MWGEVFEGFTGAFDTASDWFTNAVDKVNGNAVLSGASSIADYIGEKEAKEDSSEMSLLDRITRTETGASGSSPVSATIPRTGEDKAEGSEDFYTWETRWLKRMNSFYNPSETEVRLGK